MTAEMRTAFSDRIKKIYRSDEQCGKRKARLTQNKETYEDAEAAEDIERCDTGGFEFGDDGERGRWRRRLAVMGAAIMLLRIPVLRMLLVLLLFVVLERRILRHWNRSCDLRRKQNRRVFRGIRYPPPPIDKQGMREKEGVKSGPQEEGRGGEGERDYNSNKLIRCVEVAIGNINYYGPNQQ